MNRITLIGNLGRDPEFKHLGEKQTACLKFSLATKPNWRGEASKNKPSNWHNVVVWGRLAEHVSGLLSKGAKVFVEGEMVVRKYKGKDGSDKWAYEVTADEVQLIASAKPASTADFGAANYTDPVAPGFTADDIPY